MQRKLKTIILLFVCHLLFNSTFAQTQVKENIAKTIVRVKSGNKISTGFFWRNGSTVVTTYHSISNLNGIEVYIPSQGQWKNVSVQKTYRSGDVVLLNVIGYTSPYFVSNRITAAPSVDTEVFTIGYNSGSTNYQDRNLRVGLLQGNRLQDLLPATAEAEISRLQFPSLNTQIVYFEGALLHGFSGAPIVNYSGQLIGIADGGLENGASSISWCIHSNIIPSLENSTELLSPPNFLASTNLFSAEDTQEQTSPFTYIFYKNYQIRKIKTRKFSELNSTGAYTSADEMGLNQLLNQMRISNINYMDFTYDIYLDENTGATIVLPTGMMLSIINDNLYAFSSDSRFKFKINLQQVENQLDMQNKSVIFENTIPELQGAPPRPVWLDNRLSFLGPIVRPDGTTINRKAFYIIDYNKYYFEALAYKGNTLMGASVEMNNGCYMDPTNNLPSFYNPAEVAMYNLAIQLTTFSY